MIRALHLFPMFGADLVNGSEYYFAMLSHHLAALGVHVDVIATTARRLEATSAFAIRWVEGFPAGTEDAHGLTIHRFPTAPVLSAPQGAALSRYVLRRWAAEEQHLGAMAKGSAQLVDYYHARAMRRPALYDLLVLVGLGPWSLPMLRRALRLARSSDVILAGFVPFATIWQALAVGRITGRPVALIPLFHPDDLYHHWRGFYRSFAQADVILAQTDYSASVFRRLAPGSRTLVVGAGVDAPAFQSPTISGARFRARYGLAGKHIVLYVGRKEPPKRYDLAVSAVDLIDDPRVKLVMIGSDADQRPITSPNVIQLGKLPREELIDAYDACDVLVLPSEHESFGMVLLEAWMRCKPVIGNATCLPVASVISHGQDGFLCRTAVEIAERIAHLITEPALAARLGAHGHRKVQERYTWDAVARRVLAVYTTLAGHA